LVLDCVAFSCVVITVAQLATLAGSGSGRGPTPVACLIEAPKRNKTHTITFLLLDVRQMLALHHSTSKSIECPTQSNLHTRSNAASHSLLLVVRVSAGEPRGAIPFAPWDLLLFIVTAQCAIDVSTSARVRHAHFLPTRPSHLIFPLMLPSITWCASGVTSAVLALRVTYYVPSTYSLPLQTLTLPLLTLSLYSLLHPLLLPPLRTPHLLLFPLHPSPRLPTSSPTSPTPLTSNVAIAHR
jgi:hypothetical protein